MYHPLRGLIFAIGLTALLVGTTGWSQDTTQQARKLFAEGLSLFDAGKYADAADAFRRANELSFNWKLLYNIGQSEAAAGRNGLALESFETYLTRAADDISPERRDEVMKEIRRLRELTGALEIVAPDGSIVLVDQMERGTTPLAGDILISAGIDHEVLVRNGETELYRRAVRVNGKQRRTLIISDQKETVEKTAAMDISPAADTSDAGDSNTAAPENKDTVPALQTDGSEPSKTHPIKRSKLKIAGITLLSIGGGAVLGGVITGSLALQAGNQLDRECDSTGVCDKDQQNTLNTGTSMATASTILFTSGLALATAGVVLLVLHRRQNDERARFHLLPTGSQQAVGFLLTGRFN